MQVRVARQTAQLDAVVTFYRDRLGLPEIADPDGFRIVLVADTWTS